MVNSARCAPSNNSEWLVESLTCDPGSGHARGPEPRRSQGSAKYKRAFIRVSSFTSRGGAHDIVRVQMRGFATRLRI